MPGPSAGHLRFGSHLSLPSRRQRVHVYHSPRHGEELGKKKRACACPYSRNMSFSTQRLAKIIMPAIAAMPATSRKNCGGAMRLQKLPMKPARKPPVKLVASQIPIIIDRPTGDRYSSPTVMMAMDASTHSQLASPGPACTAASAFVRSAAVTPKQPSAILVMVEGSVPHSAWRAHRPTTNGVKAKIMNGLKARNQVVGICAVQPNRSMPRSTLVSIHKIVVLPICSYVAQNNVLGTNSSSSAMTARHSSRRNGRRSLYAAFSN